jgi:hypothetical protein
MMSSAPAASCIVRGVGVWMLCAERGMSCGKGADSPTETVAILCHWLVVSLYPHVSWLAFPALKVVAG